VILASDSGEKPKASCPMCAMPTKAQVVAGK